MLLRKNYVQLRPRAAGIAAAALLFWLPPVANGVQETPQVTDPTEAEVEELLRKLQEFDKGGSFPTELLKPPEESSPSVPFGGLVPLDDDFGAPGMHLYRMNDPVEIQRGDVRRRLQYWDPHFVLEPGDEVRFGGKSVAVIDFPDGSYFRIKGRAIVRVQSQAEDELRILDVPLLDQRIVARPFEVPTRYRLPGGNEVRGSNTFLSIERFDLRVLRLRNTGPSSVEVRGPYLPAEQLILGGGQEVFLPTPDVVGRGPSGILQATEVPGSGPHPMRVTAPQDVTLDQDGDLLLVTSEGPGSKVVSVSGARVILRPGTQMKLRRADLVEPNRNPTLMGTFLERE